MFFGSSRRGRQIALAPRSARARADAGKGSSFKHWWYFDTNCLSELVKEYRRTGTEAIANLISGKEILLSNTVLVEMRKRPDLLDTLEQALEPAIPLLAPDIWTFWDADIASFRNVDQIASNVPDVFPLPAGFLAQLSQNKRFSQVSSTMELELHKGFLSGLAPDVGSKMDERDLCMVIWSKIANHAKQYAKVEIPWVDVTPAAFPSFYVYFYTYYFKFMRSDCVAPELNDALDLTNSLPLPYCERYYGERGFTNVLKSVQGHQPPSRWALCTRAYKEHRIDYQTYKAVKDNREQVSQTSPMLEGVDIFNFSELQSHLQG